MFKEHFTVMRQKQDKMEFQTQWVVNSIKVL